MIFKKFLIAALVIPVIAFAQYGKSDYELVKTTFQRSFDREIVLSYLNSGDERKVNAALLSISHSEDTSLVKNIITLPFNNHAKFICFALGQLGENKSSTEYLWSKIFSEDVAANSVYLFDALGKTGNENDLNRLADFYANIDAPSFPYRGISLAIYQFGFRGITSDRTKQILIDEINNPFTPVDAKNDALFALARRGSSGKINDELVKILLSNDEETKTVIKQKQYALINLRVQKYFPKNEELFNKLLNETNPLLLIETAKALSLYKFNTVDEIKEFLKLLGNENQNVSITAAGSIKNFTVGNSLTDSLKNILHNYLLNPDLPAAIKGELLVSYTQLYDDKEIDEKILTALPKQYYYAYLGSDNENEKNLTTLLVEYDAVDNLSNKIDILYNLLQFRETFPEDVKLISLLINTLKSNRAPLVSIAADGSDSLLIEKHKREITDIIKQKIKAEKDNPDFMEAIMSLVNLAERIDSVLYEEVIEELKFSELYSIRKFISDKTGKDFRGTKELNNFEEIWQNAFKFSSAEIVTEKGSFVIEFIPEYAPVTTGNFCMLASKDFYNGIEFHRVVPGFVIQCGDPTATGWGGPGYDIVSEFSPLPYDIGTVGMASAGKDTEGSQWFVMQGNYPHLNGRYTVFAKVISGMDVVYNITQNDKILSVRLIP